MRSLALTMAALTVLAAAGCDDTSAPAPPDIRFGEDVCVRCNMIISDDRFAAGASVVIDGRYEPRAFDDIGCLLAFRSSGETVIAAEYVADFQTRQWLDAGSAAYLHSNVLHSPMAFGVAACAGRAEAAALANLYEGDVLDFKGILSRYDRGALRVDPAAAREEGGE